jgi:hypothetical protein
MHTTMRLFGRLAPLAARLAPALLWASFGPACIDARAPGGQGTNKPSSPTALFPPPGDLAKLPSLPAPSEAFSLDAVVVDNWSVAAPAAMQDEEAGYEDASAWGNFARSVASAHKATVRLSPALQCAAGETARFRVEKGSLPNESLRRFLVARCGGSSTDALPIVAGGEAPDKTTDASIYDHTKDVIEKAVERRLIGETHRALGVAAYRAGRKYAVAAIVGSDEVRLEAGPRTPDEARRVLLRGTLRRPAADAVALINQGDYGAAHCPRDPRVALPQFAFSCRLGDKDAAAWIQILVRREGRVLEDGVADLLAYEGDPAKIEYRTRTSGVPAPVSDVVSFTSALLGAVNRVRAEGKLAPLSLATKQSAQSARLVGTLIDASVNGKNDVGDGIALGLLAGWDVEGTIRSGQLLFAVVAPTRDARAWLDFALERPFGRRVLLDPDARRIAIGPTVFQGEAPALGAVVTSYALFESPDHDGEASSALARVAAARAELGKPALAKIDGVRALADEAKLVLAGEREPFDALSAAMRSVAQRVSGTVHGFVVETNDLERAPIPEELLHAPKGALAIQVTHHRVKGAAWGQYVILYVLVDEPRNGAGIDL